MQSKFNRSLLVIYEDDPTRTSAMGFCDQLVSRFWAKCALEVTWLSFADLDRKELAEKAFHQCANADLIIFAMDPDGQLPQAVRHWAQSALGTRKDREGAVVGLLDPAKPGGSGGWANKYTWLRNLAHRSGLDYLTQAPQNIEGMPIPDSLDSYSQRALAVTGVLDEILRLKPAHTLR